MRDPVIWWVRKDLRLSDNPALAAALDAGGPVIPVFVLDEVFESYGAAPLWRFGLGVEEFAKSLDAAGSRLICRRGSAAAVLLDVAAETGARTVRWGRAYDAPQVARDKAVKVALQKAGIDGASIAGGVLFEPWSVQTKAGAHFQVFSPFWRAVERIDVETTMPRPGRLPAPATWATSEDVTGWGLSRPMRRGASVVVRHVTIGEDAARDRLASFAEKRMDDYGERRDYPAEAATSRISEHLAWGEISPATCRRAAVLPAREVSQGANSFLKELAWREFAYHLAWHTPWILERNWREGWDRFPWSMDDGTTEVRAWRQGRTGVRLVDAAMRELYVTGYMHNRARMIVASFLTKHLVTHWRVGQRWFEDCLVDWDPASNAMGWQWTAGCGPDAAPYFRIFNPDAQQKKFDGDGAYVRRWIAEGEANPSANALSYFDAIPESWALSPTDAYPEPVVNLAEGRARALAAYRSRSF
ncbi:MAG: deoxyribodipyrimidine photo-lyase [Boseongicola sp. SB0673_bin_14]|nr:deoxyribodipyrimidine photo-lyase [Boseongicola sp. SB0673_bin_14]